MFASVKKIPLRKIINDPVHGFITIDDELIYSIISHPYYQRLRRIKQMALAYLVYPGAVHTRLHHSLGALHLMQKAIEELRHKGTSISTEESQAARIAILLHDIGHGPFSHALEHTLVDVHHEDLSLLIMQKLNEEYNGQLQLAIDIFTGTYERTFLHQLVSSQLDVDRLDYLARDSFFTGVSEGVVGYERILKMLTVYNGELVVEEKGIHSIEKFLISRRFMYWQVYLHKTVLSSELMLVTILKRAKLLAQNQVALFGTPAMQFFLQHQLSLKDFQHDQNCLQQFLLLDDNDVISCIKVWMTHSDKVLSDLCQRLNNRHLFKVKFLTDETASEILDWKRQVQQSAHLSDEDIPYYFMQDATASNTYNEGDEQINILFKNGDVKTISSVDGTLITAGLLVPVKKHYICYLRN
ncbi:MAG: HD domain-containing protein [Chitinophagaceae bacterium]|nr:HD domain-containing protein [Chitinophagaceae bacterium]